MRIPYWFIERDNKEAKVAFCYTIEGRYNMKTSFEGVFILHANKAVVEVSLDMQIPLLH